MHSLLSKHIIKPVVSDPSRPPRHSSAAPGVTKKSTTFADITHRQSQALKEEYDEFELEEYEYFEEKSTRKRRRPLDVTTLSPLFPRSANHPPKTEEDC